MAKKKIDRNEVNRQQVNEKTEEEKREIAYGVNLRRLNTLGEYIKNEFNGRYYLARYNMLATQVKKKKIIEKIDGMLKTKELVISEALLMKMRAIDSFRISHFAKNDMKEDFKMTDEQIKAVESEYFTGKIIERNYDESQRKGNKAKFVDT